MAQPDQAPKKPLLLVTGDIVLDRHFYGGVKTAATSFSEPGTTYKQHLGGAALTHGLLKASASAADRNWNQKRAEWSKMNEERRKKSLPELPTPEPFEVGLALQKPPLKSLDGQLCSYSVWSDWPARKDSDQRVWRLNRHFGYGPAKPVPDDGIFKPDPKYAERVPVLTVIDDGGILFRRNRSSRSWPEFSKKGTTHFLLKMSSPLCRGDLWAALEPVMERLIVVVSADDLRRDDAQIRHRLSWEECVESTLHALEYDSSGHDLLQAAHLIVNFRSAGALWVHRGVGTRLLFDHRQLEDDFDRSFEGTVYGFQTCVVAGVAHHLMATCGKSGHDSFIKSEVIRQAFESGIAAGLTAHRRLLELGHGAVERTKRANPGFPHKGLGAVLAESPGGFISEEISARIPKEPWTLLGQAESAGSPDTPLTGLAQVTARYGFAALSHVPALQLGRLFTVDRSEIESLRTLEALIRDYERVKVQKRPLCIGVFGPPGSGKSFGVKVLAEAILGAKAPFLEFNLSQFKSAEELIGAFHQVRDAVLRGITPVAFWDEFDSQHYKWLQYLLAPMQDGSFQEGQITHPIGKCVFIFAGGTSDTIHQFGVPEPQPLTQEERAGLTSEERTDRKLKEGEFREFKLLKGPDFVSRLHGFLDVLGVNPRKSATRPDRTWPIRRALFLRSVLELKPDDELDIDPGLLYALLNTPIYRHGARSLEKIVSVLVNDRNDARLRRAALPPNSVLARETDAERFYVLMEQWNIFKYHPDIEALAAVVHQYYLSGAKEAELEAKIKEKPELAWHVDPAVMKEYEQLDADFKASNRAAARRIPEHLVLIGFVVEPDDGSPWMDSLKKAIEKQIDRLARAEHLGWCAERRANGWSYAEKRDNDLKHHPSLVEWSELQLQDRDKDRNFVRSIPALLKWAGFKAVPVKQPA